MITITGTFESLIGAGTGYVTATLAGYGNDVPRLVGTGVIVNPVTSSVPGSSFSLALYGNDAITPAGTYYILSFYDTANNLVSSAGYSFTGTTTYDLSTTAPILGSPTPAMVLPSVDWSNIANKPALAPLDSPTFTTKVLLPDGTQTSPALATASDPTVGFYKISAGNLGFTGTTMRAVNNTAVIWCTDAAATQNKVYITANTSVGMGLSSDNKLVWRNTTVFTSGTEDVALLRDGAGILAHRSGTQNQQLYLYNTYTDSANYERLQIGGASAGTNAFLRMQAAGTGVVRGLGIGFGAANDYFFTSGGLTLASGHTLRFGPTGDATAAADTGLYRSTAGTLTIGNSTANDTSGSIVARNHTLSASGTATSGANFGSGSLNVQSSYWNGAAATAGNWTLSSNASTGTNPVINFTIQQTSGTTGQLVVYNPTQLTQTAAATSGINQSGLTFSLYARYWDGTQSQPDQWVIQNVQGAGTNPTTTLTFAHSAGSTGVASVSGPAFKTTGTSLGSTAVRAISTGVIGFNSSTTDPTVAADTAMSRTAAATMAVGNGTAGDASGKLLASNLTNIVAKVLLTGQTAAIASTPLYTPTVAGTYRVSMSSYCTTAGTAGTMDVQATASNGTFAQTYAYSITSVGGGGVQSLSGQSYRTLSVITHVGAGQPINYSTIWSGVTGTPAYGLDIVVEQLQ